MEIKLKKLGKFSWVIEKEGAMKVPAIVYANEKLLEKIKLDKTLEQTKNVTMLEGVVKNVIALPDAHQGYGFAVGNVAAFDVDTGIISPGGIGYDINCLSKDTRVASEFGYHKTISMYEKEYNKEHLIILDKESVKGKNAKITLFMKRNSDKIIKIKTESGIEISATEDHPIYTKNGMKKAGEVNDGEEVLTYPFEGVGYETPKRTLLIDEKDINNLDISNTSKLQIKKKLKSLNLLPLYSDNPKLPYILRLMGYIFGDGSLSTKKAFQIGFYGNKEDLELIRDDLKKVGFRASIFNRTREHNIRTQYKEYKFSRVEYTLKSNSSAFAILLRLLGTPEGDKTKQDYAIPEWIIKSVKWHKRLFLASLFGAELSSPKTMTHNKFNLYGPLFSLNKENSTHGINFVNQISTILEEFGIKSILLKYREDEVNGKKSTRIRLMIYPNSENLINLFSKINYDYNLKKRRLANAAILWLKQKEAVLNLREGTMTVARKMKKEEFAKSQIINSLSDRYANKYFIDKAIYHQDYGRTGSRIAYCFISFNEFVERNCYGTDGFVWDKLKSKQIIEYNDLVYDLTIDNENHNFIANGIVVSNCSVRLLKTNLKEKDITTKKKDAIDRLFRDVPSGIGKGSVISISKEQIHQILEEGIDWAIKNKYGTARDKEFTEENGRMKEARADFVSQKAISRGAPQLGSLGSGNHFLEIQTVDEIYDKEIAKVFGLEKGQVTIMIHCGSRGLGHQVASDYIKAMENEYGFANLPDRELVNAPINSKLGKEYFSAMSAAANFAFANKQIITHQVRETMKRIFPDFKGEVVYDVCHNIAKFEEYEIDGKKRMLCIHRKGATRSFGPGRKEIPEEYRKVGQPVLIPGSMGTASYVLVGTKKAEEVSFASTAHGAGRVESRHAAMKEMTGQQVKEQLKVKGIEVATRSIRGLAEEAPYAYKDIDEVVRVSHEVGIGNLVAKLKPIAVMKG